jgi:hypothetical protein
MKVKIPILVQDPQVASVEGMAVAEGYYANEPEFADGPSCPRIKIVDRNPDDQTLLPGARFYPPPPRRRTGGYLTADGKDLEKQVRQAIRSGDQAALEAILGSDEFIQVSVFSTVLKTLDLFENKDIMGRPISWAFAGQPLEVYPRARPGLNALYHRPSRNLRFFYQDYPQTAPGTPPRRVYTCLSRDVIAHETGHAILDGIEPGLLDAIGPHPRAIHEGLADMISVLMAFNSDTLSRFVLKHHFGSILEATAFSDIAEQIGPLLNSGEAPLRALINDMHLDSSQPAGYASPDKPYELCLVLSGALYHILQTNHERLKKSLADTVFQTFPDPLYSASGQALMESARRLRRNIFRALDYLPPGEISLADYGRAVCAVNAHSFDQEPDYEQWIKDEFTRRKIVVDPRELETGQILSPPHPRPIDQLYQDDSSARQFVEQNRAWIGIPDGEPFEIRPRLKVAPDDADPTCIFKIIWGQREPNQMGNQFPVERWVRVGTTLVFDWQTGAIQTRLSSAVPTPELYPDPEILQLASQAFHRRQVDTDRYLVWLNQHGLFRRRSLEEQPLGLDEVPPEEAVVAEFEGGVMHARGTGLGLHLDLSALSKRSLQ